jgi:hypothetical protein
MKKTKKRKQKKKKKKKKKKEKSNKPERVLFVFCFSLLPKVVLNDVSFDPRKIVERVVKTYRAEISYSLPSLLSFFSYSFFFFMTPI